MSELQAVFNARKKRSSSDAGVDDNSEQAIVPEIQSNAPSQTVTSNYTTNRSNTPHSPIHTSNINSNDGGIEVSPSAIGRQSLQLNNSTAGTLFPSKDGPLATPPSMPSTSISNPPIGRVNPGIKRITPRGANVRQLPSPTGGSHGRREISQDLYSLGTQKPSQSSNSNINTIVGRGSVRGNNRFGTRNSNPPTDLSPYEPSDEEPEDSESPEEQGTNNIHSSVKGAYKQKIELKDGEK